ncbi:MAG: tyrosine-type recombinase/integrase [Solirubrobacteraceae bacterium]
MSRLAPTMQAFFTDRLIRERGASPNMIAAYRDTMRLLLASASRQLGIEPSRLDLGDLDAPLISAFLDHLEHERGCSPKTRNSRLTAIRSLYRYAARRHPEHAAAIDRVLAIPPKKHGKPLITFVTKPETDALIAAVDTSTWTGRRDHVMLMPAAQTGLRATELVSLTVGDIHLGTGAHVNCLGKGRKQRITPLTKNATSMLRTWLAERRGQPHEPLFPTSHGRALSRDALEQRLAKHATAAAQQCPSIASKIVTPHVLRHTTAMRLLHAGIDTSAIALWLGHEQVETTQIYLHADLTIKEHALARTTPPNGKPGRYRPPDPLLAFLEQL